MQHDESWLHTYAEREAHKSRLTDKIYVTVEDSVITCKAYHDHMTVESRAFDKQMYNEQEDVKVNYEDRIAELETRNSEFVAIVTKLNTINNTLTARIAEIEGVMRHTLIRSRKHTPGYSIVIQSDMRAMDLMVYPLEMKPDDSRGQALNDLMAADAECL
jgi:hypothetical protein